MAVPVSEAYIEALAQSSREIDIDTRIRSRTGEVRIGPADIDLEEGEVSWSWPGHLDAPVHTARAVYADPDRLLDVDLTAGDGNDVWFSTKLDLQYGLRTAGGSFEYCPSFRGWIVEVNRDGPQAEIIAVGKEVHHQGASAITQSYQTDAGTSRTDAIQDLFDARGMDDDLFDFIIPTDNPTFKRNRHLTLGMSPWRAAQAYADDVDMQLLFRQDGHLVLREWPTLDDIEWEFDRSNTTIIKQWPKQRLSLADFVNTVYVTTEKVVNDGPLSADRPEPVVGFAELPDSAALSALTLSGGNKPLVKIVHRAGITTFLEANTRADNILARDSNGIEAEMGIVCLPLPHLEPMDVIRVAFGVAGIDIHRFRAKRATYGLTEDSDMAINWQGHRKPDHKNKHKFGKRKGRRRRR